MHELPGSLRLTSTFPFVGRSAELETLRALMPTAEGEGRRVVLLGGEPGSGKSRLVREFAAEAAGSGALVLYGACDAVVRTPYGPFVEALEHVARVIDPAELRAALGTSGGELTRLLPDLPARVGDLPAPVEADPDTERHRLHTAVTELLAGLSARPVLLVLEDGHWADAPTLLLLRHLARAAGHARVLLLATFRDTEADVPEALSETLADLRRSDDVVRMRLAGLSDDEVGEFVRHAAQGDAGAGQPELAGRSASSPAATPSSSASCGARWSRPASWRSSTASIRPTRPLARARHPGERARGRQPAALAPGARDDRPAGAHGHRRLGVRASTSSAQAAGLERARPARRARRGRPQRHDRGAARRAGSPTASRTSSSAARSTTGSPGCGARSCTCASARRSSAPRVARAARSPTSRTTSPPPRRSTTPSAASSTTSAPRGRPAPRSRSTRRRRGCAPRSSCGIEDPARRAEVFLELGTASHRAGDATRRAGGVQGDGGHRPRAGRRRAARARRDRLRGGVLAPGHRRPGRGRAARGGGDRARRGQLGAARRAAQRARPRARLPGRPRARRDRPHQRGRHGPAAATTRSRWPRTLVRSYWSRGTSSLDEILAMLTEARDLGEELGDTEIVAEAMAWRVPTFVALGDLESARREVAALLRHRRADRRSRSCSTSPSTTARRSRCATGASTRPRPGRSARTSGAGC